MGVRAGVDCYLYRNTGTWGTPTWNLVDLVIDASLDLSLGTAEVKRRGVNWAQNITTLKVGNLSFNMVRDVSDADHDAIRDYLINRTLASWAFADGAIATTGTQYFKAEFYTTKFAIGQPLEGVETVDVELMQAYSSNAPAFITV